MSFFRIDDARPVGPGLHSPAGSLTDPDLARRIERYKRLVASRYRGIAPTAAYELGQTRMLVSPKIDGETWFLIVEPGRVALANPRGRVLSGAIPVLEEARAVAARVTERVVMAGELFSLRKGARPRHGDLAAVLGGGERAETDRIGFTAFDLVEEAGDDGSLERYSGRLAVMNELLAGGMRLRAVQTDEVREPGQVGDLYARWVDSGKAEGLVVRTDGRIWKVKPEYTLDAVVLGYTLRGEDTTQVRSLLLGLIRDDGHVQIIGSCGNMGVEADRRSLRERLQGADCASSFRHASSDGALYQFVRPELVVEVKVNDIQAEGAEGDAVPRMVLEFQDGGWSAVRKMPGVSLLGPVLLRVRDDKSPTAAEAGAGQIADRVLLPDSDVRTEVLELPRSTVVRRDVWVKVTKQKLAVRKLLVWKTNKEAVDPRYPAFVVHWTDYSADRKEPLQRTVRLAPTQDRAIEIAEQLICENIKKGWDQVDPKRA